MAQRDRDARYRAAHPDKRTEYDVRYYAAHREQKAAYDARYRAEHRDQLLAQRAHYRATNRDAILAQHLRYNSAPANRMRQLVNNARVRALATGLDFDPGLLDVLIAAPSTHCACCGVLLDYSTGRGRNNTARHSSPSLDRVNNIRGYTLDNVAVICWRCNRLKSFATLADLEALTAYVKRHQQEGDAHDTDPSPTIAAM
jgi:hypothetical protein